MPHLPSAAEQTSSIGLTDGSNLRNGEVDEVTAVGKWEDEEERRFYEDIQDVRDFVPKSVLGLDEKDNNSVTEKSDKARDEKLEQERKKREEDEAKELENELKKLELEGDTRGANFVIDKGNPEDERYILNNHSTHQDTDQF